MNEYLFSVNIIIHRKYVMGVTRLYIFKKKLFEYLDSFNIYIYILTLIFHNMIYKIRTNNWRTEKFLNIHCNPNVKCNTLSDWLIDKLRTKKGDF